MTQHTTKSTKSTRSVTPGKKNACRVSTNVKAGWKWLDDLKEKVSNNIKNV